jgi:hypothetical protein
VLSSETTNAAMAVSASVRHARVMLAQGSFIFHLTCICIYIPIVKMLSEGSATRFSEARAVRESCEQHRALCVRARDDSAVA